MDRIFIEHLSTKGRHGVSDEERAREQEFVLDIGIDFDTRPSAQSDSLSDTIDYGFFRGVAKKIVEESSFHLLEKLAGVIAQEILGEPRIGRVSVTVRKTGMFKDCTPGVTVVRERV